MNEKYVLLYRYSLVLHSGFAAYSTYFFRTLQKRPFNPLYAFSQVAHCGLVWLLMFRRRHRNLMLVAYSRQEVVRLSCAKPVGMLCRCFRTA